MTNATQPARAGENGRWVFDYCHACAENPEGIGPNAAGVGCPDGPSDDCEAVWLWQSAGPTRVTRSLAEIRREALRHEQ